MRKEVVDVIIMGAGGRDFHNFNTFFRHRPDYRVVAFTASQIPFIAHRTYPPTLSGPLYPEGIPIYPEEDLPRLLAEGRAQLVAFSYSDISHEELMSKASLVLSLGKNFILLGPDETMLRSRLPVISVCAVRTGCGKSVITRKLASLLFKKGVKVSVIRHPMAYCTFKPVLRFSTLEEVDREACTIEEREEFEPLVEKGITVYAGVDYEEVLKAAEGSSEILLWDGGNNDFPFLRSDLEIVLIDALRPGHERSYYPGEVNLRRADLILITKVNEGGKEALERIHENIFRINPSARVMETASVIEAERPDWVEGRRVMVIEDGPTLTHGGMSEGAGAALSRRLGAELVDPRPFAVGTLKEVFEQYPHIQTVLPAMGYSEEQIRDLEATLRNSDCETVVLATPADLRRKIRIDQPTVRVRYDFDIDLAPVVDPFLKR
ncbi:MAG: GTPase [Desulfobacterota bacterium]|nr:GTPase [Thermodesulfobacteriota bacterium]